MTEMQACSLSTIINMQRSEYNLAIVVLAAGESSRFDGIKQLAMVQGDEQSETTLLQRTVKVVNALESTSVSVVLGANAQEILQNSSTIEGVNYITCEQWPEGMSASIATGCKNIPSQSSHILIVLADQVALEQTHFNELIEQSRLHHTNIICSQFKTENGARNSVPAIFPVTLTPQLMSLTGDQGARKIINDSDMDVLSVLLPEAAIDIDTKEQLNDWRKASANKQDRS